MTIEAIAEIGLVVMGLMAVLFIFLLFLSGVWEAVKSIVIWFVERKKHD